MRVYYDDSVVSYTRGKFGTLRLTLLAWPIALLLASIIGFALGGALQVVPATGQIAALGWNGAWNRYHKEWLSFALTAALGMVVALVCAAIVDRVYIWIHMRRRSRYEALFKLLLLISAVCAVVWATAYSAFLQAKGQAPPVTALIAVHKLEALLLDRPANVDADRLALRRMESEAQRLAMQRAEAEHRVVEMRRLLSGANPITKGDLDTAQRNGWWQGLILGLLTSVAGSFIFHRLTGARPTQAPSDRDAV